jgi:adenylate cyclase
MPQEIERKFLLANDGWRAEVARFESMRQGYLATDSRCSIRIRISDEHAYLNIKSATLGVARHEFEYPVPFTDAAELLTLFCHGRCVEKTRYYVPFGLHTWEIDVFEGTNTGLIVAEIELTAEDEPFEHPEWLGDEVSHDRRYYNSCLIDHPYSAWGVPSQS